jgi:hypothetical protein
MSARTIAGVDHWLERYHAGDRVQVWTEMTSLGPTVRDVDSFADAVEVAQETMRRARANVERLLELLPERGYEFEESELPVFTPPSGETATELDRLEERIGRLPLALRCWFEEVGQVNLIGQHPEWDYDYADPLVVMAPPEYVLSEYEAWEADRGADWDRGEFEVDIAPDYLHKADVSGGPPYSVAVPNEGADGLLLWERHQTTFANYLRICFRWGGFPGWDRGSLDGWAKPPTPPPSLLTELAESLLPI